MNIAAAIYEIDKLLYYNFMKKLISSLNRWVILSLLPPTPKPLLKSHTRQYCHLLSHTNDCRVRILIRNLCNNHWKRPFASAEENPGEIDLTCKSIVLSFCCSQACHQHCLTGRVKTLLTWNQYLLCILLTASRNGAKLPNRTKFRDSLSGRLTYT